MFPTDLQADDIDLDWRAPRQEPGLVITPTCAFAPMQADLLVDGRYPGYFRYRWNHWQVALVQPGYDPVARCFGSARAAPHSLLLEGRLPNVEDAAGWMEPEQALGLIRQAVQRFRHLLQTQVPHAET